MRATETPRIRCRSNHRAEKDLAGLSQTKRVLVSAGFTYPYPSNKRNTNNCPTFHPQTIWPGLDVAGGSGVRIIGGLIGRFAGRLGYSSTRGATCSRFLCWGQSTSRAARVHHASFLVWHPNLRSSATPKFPYYVMVGS